MTCWWLPEAECNFQGNWEIVGRAKHNESHFATRGPQQLKWGGLMNATPQQFN